MRPLAVVSTLLLLTLAWPADLGPLERVGRVGDRELCEVSGTVRSRVHPGVFWVHNDSGNPAALFAIRADGTVLRRYAVAAPNLDWEDIATDDEGHLYVGDIGNNRGWLPRRAVYAFDEPDPSRPAEGPLRPTRVSYYRFPEGGRFDAEGLFVDEGRAIVVEKRLDGRAAGLFAIPLDPPAPADAPALPARVGTLEGFREPATGADLASDGRRLAVCGVTVGRVYERREGGGWRPSGAFRVPPGVVEAVAWDGDDLLLVSEPGEIYRVDERAWRPGSGSGRDARR